MASVVEQSNNRRIAKNAIALYVRMLLSILVSLYTSRVVLNTLGVEDFGIYGVVGGVVGMMGFLNAAMSGATSRFLTFELGRGDSERLHKTFSSAMIIHIGIALTVFVVAETIGLWFVNTQLVIPENRMVAANWTYQFSVFAAMVSITQVPYNADIIANEKMDVYAYVELLNVALKLAIVYLLILGDIDKLILYAFLMLCVSVVIAIIYRVYCLRHFSESRFSWVWDKTILKPMLTFSGWDLYGNMSVTVRQQGTNMLLNIFFGPIVNAASSITTTVNGALLGLAQNVVTAFRPQIIKSYSINDWGRFNNLIVNGAQFTCALFIILSLAVFFELPLILNIWLGQIPDYVIEFCRISLIANCVGVVNAVVNIGIHSTGDIRRISFITGSIILSSLLCSYVVLKLGCEAHSVYVVLSVIMLLVLATDCLILKKQVPEFQLIRFVLGLIKILLIAIVAIVLVAMCNRVMAGGFARFLLECVISVSVIGVLSFFIILSKQQRCDIISSVKRKMRIKPVLK